MKKLLFLFSLVILSIFNSKAQNFYFKINTFYHLPLTTMRESPIYMDAILLVPGTSGLQEFNISWGSIVKDFSLVKGLNYRLSGGYNFNERIAFELGLDYFQRNTKMTGNTNYVPNNQTAEWKFNTFNFIPTLVLKQNFGKYAMNAKLGVILGFAQLHKSYLLNSSDERNTIVMQRNVNLGYNLAIEGQYQFSSRMSFSLEIGINNLFYTPHHGKITETFYNQSYYTQIDYKKSINTQNFSSQYPDYQQPQQRLRETTKFNSIYMGIGLQYQFKK